MIDPTRPNYPVPLAAGLTRLPVGGQVSCGFPSPAADHKQPELSLDELVGLGPRSSLFLLEAWGDSMRDHGIYNGDILIVDKAAEAKLGNIVVAIIDSEFLVKKIGKTADNRMALLSGNTDYKPIILEEDQAVDIWGVCTWNLHRHTS
tara:strand:+ start:1505 stop:1948 length:444 start_codon:yes stop_codon:yes gene_type:complete